MRTSPYLCLSACLNLSLILAMSGCSQSSSTPPVTPTQPIQGSSAIAGRVTEGPGCADTSLQLLLYSGNTVIYQTTVPPNGTYEFQAQPGSYLLSAQGSAGCQTQQNVTVVAGQQAQVQLQMMPMGNYANSPPLSGPGYPGAPPSSNYPPNYPPCPYGYYGCNGGYYPGGGGAGVGKPNIYVSGAEGTELKLGIKYKSESNLLIAVPAHGPQGWTGKILGKSDAQTIQIQALGEVPGQVNSAKYPYLFYDLRTDDSLLQNKSAFCVPKAELMPSLLNFLKSSRFKKNELEDFSAYWDKKFPPAERYCVYPQENDSIDRIVTLEVTPTPKSVTRVWFLVIPDLASVVPSGVPLGVPPDSQSNYIVKPSWAPLLAAHKKTDPKFLPRIAEQKNRSVATETPMKPGAETALEIREWGVVFLFENKK